VTKKERRISSRHTLAENLRTARSLYGWSQEELGFQCGLKRTYVGALERVEINLGSDNLDKLASGLGLPPHLLLTPPEQAYPEIYAAASKRNGRR